MEGANVATPFSPPRHHRRDLDLHPRAVEFRNSLPRTETGKLQRFRLRA